MAFKALIASIQPNSIAEEIGLVPGDALVSVNGESVSDIIDLSFALADETVDLVIEKESGELVDIEIEKEFDEDLGIEFESAVFDGVRRCGNRCIFCFVDQMPPGMRESLYVKDDDYRLSFLYGNFVTLSNLGPKDMDRIRRLHLSPLFVSVHTTDGELRASMLNNKRAAGIMQQLNDLIDIGVEFHAQVVLCPGFNDGLALQKTFEDLYKLSPAVLSMAIVPVGLTRYRENCFELKGFTAEQAGEVIDAVSKWQEQCRREQDRTFVYLGDEFYMAAGRALPPSDEYDGFPQLENGIGLVRSFIDEWQEQSLESAGYKKPFHVTVVCGISAAKIITPLADALTIPNLIVRVVPIENTFFGKHITVTGLLTATDIINQLRGQTERIDALILPGVALRKGENVFLDGRKPDDISQELNVPVRSAWFAQDLLELLKTWR